MLRQDKPQEPWDKIHGNGELDVSISGEDESGNGATGGFGASPDSTGRANPLSVREVTLLVTANCTSRTEHL